MKALYTSAPAVYELTDRPKPVPRAGEVVVKVGAAALCHTDVIIRSGLAGHVTYPVIPGHEFSGVVESCASDVARLKPGDRVAVETIFWCGNCGPCRRGDTNGCENYDECGSKCDGGFAEYCVAPARHLIPLPDHVSLAEAALTEPLSNAVSAIRHAGIRSGDKVLIIGPGPIGLLALQVAKLYNPSMVVLAGTRDERLALGMRLGATHTVNVAMEGGTQMLRNLLPKGADVAVECAGTRSALDLAMDMIGWGGRIVEEGVFDTEEMVPISPYRLLLSRTVSLIGVAGWTAADFYQALQLIGSGSVHVKPLITHTISIGDWETGFDLITRHKNEAIKVEMAF